MIEILREQKIFIFGRSRTTIRLKSENYARFKNLLKTTEVVMTEKVVTLHFERGKLKFSAGHFTIFSATEREPLHGHNYTLEVLMTAAMQEPGITFDYRHFEDYLVSICRQLHLHLLLPAHSPHLIIEEETAHYRVTYHHETMQFLKKDVVILPLSNITLEELSQWFVDQLAKNFEFLTKYAIKNIVVKVFNGPSHGAEAELKI